MTTFTNEAKAQAAEREAWFRRRVYPRWIKEGRMEQAAADREIALMEAIAADYRRMVEEEEAKERLL